MNSTIKKKILNEYNEAKIPIIGIAQKYGVTVEDVLRCINATDGVEIQTVGDLIDDAGPAAEVNKQGKTIRQRYTTN